jgi:hypothetical protein
MPVTGNRERHQYALRGVTGGDPGDRPGTNEDRYVVMVLRWPDLCYTYSCGVFEVVGACPAR